MSFRRYSGLDVFALSCISVEPCHLKLFGPYIYFALFSFFTCVLNKQLQGLPLIKVQINMMEHW